MRDMIGHNTPSLDAVVEENLLRGLYLSQLNSLLRCVDDPRMSRRHHQVLAQIIQRTNAKTGTAYPGRSRLAADITYYVNGEAKHYSEGTVANTISELVDCGYIIAEKRAVDGKGRALAHYVTTVPSVEDLQSAITAWCTKIRGQPKREFPVQRAADVTTGDDVSASDDLSREAAKQGQKRPISRSDVITGNDVIARVDVIAGAPTVTGNKNSTLFEGDDDDPAPTKKKTQIAANWQPSRESVLWVTTYWMAEHYQIVDQADHFRDYHDTKCSKFKDWDKAWRNWWRNGYHKIPKRKGRVVVPPEALDAEREVAAAFERARLMDEEDARCRR